MITSTATDSKSPVNDKLQQSPSKLPRFQAPAEATESAESEQQASTPTSQPGSSAKRQLGAGQEEEVLHLVQGYLPLEDQQKLQQQQRLQQQPVTNGSTTLNGHESPIAANHHPQHNAAAAKTAIIAKHPFSDSQPTTAAAADAAAAPVSIRPLSSTVLPTVGTSDAVSSEVMGVLGAWYAMYCPDKEAHLQAALMQHYDPKARFEDNFVQVFGREQIGVQFYGMRRLVKGIDLTIEKVEVLSGDEQTTTSGANGVAGLLSTLASKPQTGTYQLRVICRIAFYLPASIRGPVTAWILPEAVEAWATDILTVRQADNKIVHHQQRVHNIPVGPWPLRCYLGVSSSLFMMHILGW
jgi:hypothetical protein